MNYDEIEQGILSENPYNWKKHFLFQLPEILSFVLKWILIVTIAHLFLVSVIASSIAVAVRVSSESDIQGIIDEIK